MQTIASGVYINIKLTEPFNNSRFQAQRTVNEMILTISSVKKEDEAFYFCQSGTEFSQNFVKGFFLTIKGMLLSVVFPLLIITNLLVIKIL